MKLNQVHHQRKMPCGLLTNSSGPWVDVFWNQVVGLIRALALNKRSHHLNWTSCSGARLGCPGVDGNLMNLYICVASKNKGQIWEACKTQWVEMGGNQHQNILESDYIQPICGQPIKEQRLGCQMRHLAVRLWPLMMK